MGEILGIFLLATGLGGPTVTWELAQPRPLEQSAQDENEATNWCREGSLVMIPDGREGRVTSIEGDICRVLAYGEAYVSIWTYDLVEPVYPQETLNRSVRNFGH